MQGESYAAPEVRYEDESCRCGRHAPWRSGCVRTSASASRCGRPSEVEGPLRRGERLGRVGIYVDGRPVATVPLRVGREVEEASVFARVSGFLGDEKHPRRDRALRDTAREQFS